MIPIETATLEIREGKEVNERVLVLNLNGIITLWGQATANDII